MIALPGAHLAGAPAAAVALAPPDALGVLAALAVQPAGRRCTGSGSALRHRQPRRCSPRPTRRIPAGGFVLESKSAILARLPPEVVPRFARLELPADPAERVRRAAAAIEALGLDFPVVGKPDVGERGAGVAILHDGEDLRLWLEAATGVGPAPGVRAGRGVRRLLRPPPGGAARPHLLDHREELPDRRRRRPAHPRGADPRRRPRGLHGADLPRAQRRAARRGAGRGRAHRAGRHRQPLPGRGLPRRPARWRRRSSPRASTGSPAPSTASTSGASTCARRASRRFRRGEELSVIELNGVTSEATHIYEPGASLLAAWRTLFEQWRLAFAIGRRERRARRARPTPLGELARPARRAAPALCYHPRRARRLTTLEPSSNPAPRSLLTLVALGPAPGAAQAPLAARPAASAEAVLAAGGADPRRRSRPARARRDGARRRRARSARRPSCWRCRPAWRSPSASPRSRTARAAVDLRGELRARAGEHRAGGRLRALDRADRPPGGLRIVVHTAGEPTPVRLEVDGPARPRLQRRAVD